MFGSNKRLRCIVTAKGPEGQCFGSNKKEVITVPTANPPLWVEIATDLRRRVNDGEWTPGQKLPPMRQLAEQYRAGSHMPVNRAVMQLVSEGVFSTDPAAPRRGVHVRSTQVLVRPLFSFPRSGQTFEHSTGADRVEVSCRYDWGAASQEITDDLQIPAGTEILTRMFGYTLDGTPHQLTREHMPADLARACGLTGPEVEVPGRPSRVWLRKAGVELKRESIALRVRVPTSEEREMLAVPQGISVIDRAFTTFDVHDKPVTTWRTLVVADRIIYTAEFDYPIDTDTDAEGAGQC
jgi:GntR family transcriptional regulator